MSRVVYHCAWNECDDDKREHMFGKQRRVLKQITVNFYVLVVGVLVIKAHICAYIIKVHRYPSFFNHRRRFSSMLLWLWRSNNFFISLSHSFKLFHCLGGGVRLLLWSILPKSTFADLYWAFAFVFWIRSCGVCCCLCATEHHHLRNVDSSEGRVPST